MPLIYFLNYKIACLGHLFDGRSEPIDLLSWADLLVRPFDGERRRMTNSASQLRCYQNWLALDGLLEPRSGWIQTIQDAGYDGIQFIEPLNLVLVEQAHSHGLGICGSGRVNLPEDAERLAREALLADLECLTLHIGWGYEKDDEAIALIEA